MYKIAVAGPIPRDTITTHRGDVIEKYGCVTHPVIALAKLLENEGEVFPVSHIRKEDLQPITEVFSAYANINTQGIYTRHDQGTIIELKFLDQNNRQEKQIAKMHPIEPEDMEPFLDADAFVFVPITDFEVQPETLKYIKSHSKGIVIFDAHGPTTLLDADGNRHRRYWDDKDEWLPHIDVLKMNLEESVCCWFERDYQQLGEAIFKETQHDHLEAFASYVLEKGVSVVYITLDSGGAKVYSKNKKGLHQFHVPSVKVDHVVDTTGCGDSFAGGLAYGLTVHKDIIKAAQYANVLGALRTQGKTFDVFKNRDETNEILRQTYS